MHSCIIVALKIICTIIGNKDDTKSHALKKVLKGENGVCNSSFYNNYVKRKDEQLDKGISFKIGLTEAVCIHQRQRLRQACFESSTPHLQPRLQRPQQRPRPNTDSTGPPWAERGANFRWRLPSRPRGPCLDYCSKLAGCC